MTEPQQFCFGKGEIEVHREKSHFWAHTPVVSGIESRLPYTGSGLPLRDLMLFELSSFLSARRFKAQSRGWQGGNSPWLGEEDANSDQGVLCLPAL